MRALTQRQLWIRLAVALLLPLTVGGLFLGSRSGPTTARAAVVDLDTPAEVNGAPIALGRELAAELVNGTATENLTWVQLSAVDAAKKLESGELAAVVTIPADFSTDATAAGRGEEPRRATIVIETSPVTTLSENVLSRAVASAATRTAGSTITSSYLENAFVTWRQAGTALANTSAEADSVAGQAADLSEQASGSAQDAQTVASQVSGASKSLDAASDPAVSGDPVGTMSDLQGAAGSAKTAGAAASTAGQGTAAAADQTATGSTAVAGVSNTAKTNAAATAAAVAALQLQAADLKQQAQDQAGTAAGYQAQVQAATVSQKALQTQMVAVQNSVADYVDSVAALAKEPPAQPQPSATSRTAPASAAVTNPLAPQLRAQAEQLRALADALEAQDVSAAREQAQKSADAARLAYTSAIRLGHDLAALKGQYANSGVGVECPYSTPADCRIWKAGVVKGLTLSQEALDANAVIKKTRAADEGARAVLRQLILMDEGAADLATQARDSAAALDELANTPVTGGDTGALMAAIKEVAEQGGAVSNQAGAAANKGAEQVKAMSDLENSAGTMSADSEAVGTAAAAQAEAIGKVNQSMGDLNTTLGSLQAQADALKATAQTNNEKSKQLATQLDDLATQAAALANQTDTAASTVSQSSQGQEAAAEQVRAAAAGASQIAAGAQKVSENANQVSSGTTKVATTAKKGVDASPDVNAGSERVIDVLANPVTSDVKAPPTVTWITVLVILACWIGAMAVAWGIPVVGTRSSTTQRSGADPGGGTSAVLRELAPRVGVAVLQALLLGLAAYPSLTVIGPRTDQMMATIAISAVVFTLVNLALAVWLRGWGMLISTIMALITLAAAASPVTNLGMTVLRSLSPASVGLDAIRAAAITGSATAGQTVLLLFWAALGVTFATLGILRTADRDEVVAQPQVA